MESIERVGEAMEEKELIVFSLGDESFAIPVMDVREIIQPLPVTAIPHTGQEVEGIIRLRDEVLPLINLYKVLDIPHSQLTEDDKFIIGEIKNQKVAFRVQAVSKIYRVLTSAIEDPVELTEGRKKHVSGIVKMEERFSLLLDFKKIFHEVVVKSSV